MRKESPRTDEALDQVLLDVIVERRWLISAFVLVSLVGLYALFNATGKHRVSSLVAIKPANQDPLAALSETIISSNSIFKGDDKINTYLDVVTSRKSFGKIYAVLKTKYSEQEIQKHFARAWLRSWGKDDGVMTEAQALHQLKRRLTITNEDGRKFQITASGDRRFVVSLVNVAAEVVVEQINSFELENLSNATDYLKANLEQVEAKIKSIANEYSAVRKDHPTTPSDIATPSPQLIEIQNTLDQLRARLDLENGKLLSLIADVERLAGESPTYESMAADLDGLREALTQHYRDATRKPNNELLAASRQEILRKLDALTSTVPFMEAVARHPVLSASQTAVQQLFIKNDDVAREIQVTGRMLAEMIKREAKRPDVSQHQVQLLSELDTENKIATNLKLNLINLEIQKTYKGNISYLLEEAVAEEAVLTPPTVLASAFSTLTLTTGLILGLAWRKKRFPTVMRPSQIEDCGIQVLTTIPHVGSMAINLEVRRRLAVLKRGERSQLFTPLQAVFRHVCIQLDKALERTEAKGTRVVMVNSPLPADGKSFLAVHLALSYAETGMRVLLVDCDSYKGHPSSTLLRSQGLAHAGGGSDVTTIASNLSTCAVPGPEVEGRLPELKKSYDLIVMDSAPLLPVPDMIRVACSSDLLLVCVRHGETDLASVQKYVSLVMDQGVPMYAVLNGSTAEKTGGSYRGYAYGKSPYAA